MSYAQIADIDFENPKQKRKMLEQSSSSPSQAAVSIVAKIGHWYSQSKGNSNYKEQNT